MNENTFCSLPFSGIFLGPDGGVRPCCSLKEDLGNIKNSTINEILFNEKSKSLRKSIIENKWHTLCLGCKNLEERNGRSERCETLSDMGEFEGVTENFFKLQRLDLRWSNTCNLSCIYCWEYFSSKWAEIKKIKINDDSRNQESLITFILGNQTSIKKINLLGGEPLLQKYNLDLLEDLSPEIPIYTLTNLALPLRKNPIFQILSTKNCTGWGVSFETIGEKYEFVRHGAKWDQFLENISYLKEKNITIDVHPLYCLFSALKLTEFFDFIHETGIFDRIIWNMLINIADIDVLKAPKSIKEKAINEIEAVKNKYYKIYDLDFLLRIENELITTIDNRSDNNTGWFYQLDKHIKDKKGDFQKLWPGVYEELYSR